MPTGYAAGSPVFFHGPEDSSPTRFIGRHPVGVACASLESGAIIAALERAADPVFQASARQAARRALEEELGLAVSRERFAQLMGVQADALHPVA